MRSAFDLERFELPEGIPIVFQRFPRSSGISVVSWVGEASTAHEKRGKEGLATLTGRLLKSGTSRHTKRVLADELDRIAASISVEVDGDATTVEIRGPTVLEDRLIELLLEVVYDPVFPSDEVDRARRMTIERLRRDLTQPTSLSERRFMEALFPPGHPYHYSPMGEVRSVGRITRADLREFHRKHYTAPGSKFAVTSSRDAKEVLGTLRRSLRTYELSDRPVPTVSPPSVRERNGGPPRVFPVKGSQQVSVIVGGLAPAIGDPSRPALELAHEVLGSRPVLSRLFQVVREQNGLAYYADSSLHMMKRGGYWLATAGTALSSVGQVRDLLLREVRELGSSEVPPNELDTIRNSYIGSLPLLLDTPQSAHTLAQEVTIYELPLDHLLHWPERLKEVSPRELQEAVRTRLGSWSDPLVVLSGPPFPATQTDTA